jgi:predicted ferric reductase
MQYYIIQLTNFQAGMDTITSYAFLTLAIWVFRNYLTNKNWRYTHYASAIFSNILGLLWLLVYYNYGGMRTPWFTIFIDLDQSFVTGKTLYIYS